MTNDDLEERMRQAIAAGSLEPGAPVWEGVVARRARAPRRWTRRRIIVAGAALAAGVAALVLYLRANPGVDDVTPGRVTAPKQAGEPSLFGPGALLAQSSAPAYPLLATDDPIGLRLRPGTWSYVVRRGSDSIGSYSYSTRRTEFNGLPAWLLVEEKGPPTVDRRGTDSLWTTADSMRPLMRISLLASGRREQTFRDDDVLIGTTTNGFTTWETVRLRDSTRKHSGAIIRWPEVTAMLQTARLSAEWTGSIPLAGSGEFGRITPTWFNFAVEGSETVTVPAGTFECWRIHLGMKTSIDSLLKGARPGMTLWVSKDKQWLVQEAIVVPGKASWTHVLIFAKEE